MHLRSGQIIKHLRDAGAQIVATPEQAKSLESLGPLVKISKQANSTVDESQTINRDVQEMITKMQSVDKSATASSSSSEENAVEGVEEEMENESELDEYESAQMKKKAEAEKEAVDLYGKFVNLIDILPPLPEKGDFKVENIKKSQYFFS